MLLQLRHTTFDLDRRVVVMAIVNRTRDSFYDRGRTYELGAALEHALAQVEAGADIVDVGGVKGGPGAEVTTEEELERVVPFIEAFRTRCDAPVSVDTFRAPVARAALASGADVVNDVSGLADLTVADVVAAHPRAGLVIMHTPAQPRTRPFRPVYEPDVTTAVARHLAARAEQAQARGVPAERIIVDPGHDFGKNTFHSLELTRRLPEIADLGYPVLVAMSNKDFLGEALGLPLTERTEASLAAAVAAVTLGARLVRVHDTRTTVRAVRTLEAILDWRRPARALRGLE